MLPPHFPPHPPFVCSLPGCHWEPSKLCWEWLMRGGKVKSSSRCSWEGFTDSYLLCPGYSNGRQKTELEFQVCFLSIFSVFYFKTSSFLLQTLIWKDRCSSLCPGLCQLNSSVCRSRAFRPSPTCSVEKGGYTHSVTCISAFPLFACRVQLMGALGGGQGWEENEVGVFILLVISLLGCGLVTAVFLCRRAQSFGAAFR